jgi:hypothetical protein
MSYICYWSLIAGRLVLRTEIQPELTMRIVNELQHSVPTTTLKRRPGPSHVQGRDIRGPITAQWCCAMPANMRLRTAVLEYLRHARFESSCECRGHNHVALEGETRHHPSASGRQLVHIEDVLVVVHADTVPNRHISHRAPMLRAQSDKLIATHPTNFRPR